MNGDQPIASLFCSALDGTKRKHRYRRHVCLVAVTLGFAVGCVAPLNAALAHGYAGKRFFPATLATDDPFVADELSLPTVSTRRTNNDGDPTVTATRVSVDFTKRITPNLGIGFGAGYVQLRQEGEKTQHGFDNLSTNVKYQFYKSDEHETILSLGADVDIGGTGSRHIGAESFSTVTPTIFFGKGFGDLPDGIPYLKPFALTGSVRIGIPTRASNRSIDVDSQAIIDQNPAKLKVGFALEYSLPYLNAFVKDVGLREPFNRLIPIVEVALEKPINRGRGPTTGTVNPGILVADKYTQWGIEAVIPINHRTAGKTGVLLQLHFFMDDLFPKSIGKPLFGN